MAGCAADVLTVGSKTPLGYLCVWLFSVAKQVNLIDLNFNLHVQI